MVKLKKRVAINKISHFFKNNPLVIFFHCSNRNYFHEKIKKSIEINQSLLSSKVLHTHASKSVSPKKEENLDFTSNQNGISKEDLMIKLIKNKYAKKALLESKLLKKNNSASFSILSSKESIFTVESACLSVENQGLNDNNKTEKRFVKKNNDKILGTSLLQGNNLLIGFKSIKLLNALNLIKEFADDENIDVLGGIYENSIVDHNQIKRLAEISEDKQIYKDLNNQLENGTLNLMCELTKKFNFNFLLHPHYKVITLLKLLASKKIVAQ